MKINKILIVPLISVLFSLSACSFKEEAKPVNTPEMNEKQNDAQLHEIYRLYTLTCDEPLSYEDWLESIAGKDGKDGTAPSIRRGSNGNWFINDVDTGIPYQGEQGALGDKGPQGDKGEKGDKGQTGEDAKTPYELYKEAHPDYDKDEDTWYTDIANGLLGEQIYHTVTFDSNGGSLVEAQQVLHGEKAIKPEAPTKEGYTFNGWYYENEPWSFIGLPVISDITLVASWL